MPADETSPRGLELPRDGGGLATSESATERLERLLPTFLRDYVEHADADGLVVRLDGRIESSVAAVMAVDAVGPARVTGLVMPAQMNDEAPARDAEAFASVLGIEHHRLQLQPLLTAFQRIIGTAGEPIDDLVAIANANERFRMTCAYYIANTTNRLVVGSANRTELLLGSVAKYGKNGVDVSLLGDLYRTEVEALARNLGLPAERPEGRTRQTRLPEPTDAEKLGIDSRTLDRLLHGVVDSGHGESTVAERLEIDVEVVQRAKAWCLMTRHKRQPPSKPSRDI